MRKCIALSFLLLSMSLLTQTIKAQELSHKPFKRADSFFGLHFDFHATDKDNKIGETMTEELVDSMLTIIKPDYIQVDCKGHPGISSYPTKVGNPAPGFVKDPYPIWRKATSKHGVGLFVHYSGVIDQEAVKKHPDWAAHDQDGKIRSGKKFGAWSLR